MRLKRKNVDDAITKMTQLRNVSSSLTQHLKLLHINDPGDHILRLPGEVRNTIYRYALDIDAPTNPTIRILGRPNTVQRAIRAIRGLGLLRTSKQISVEARTMMEAIDIAYIPVISNIKYERIIDQILTRGPASMNTADSTVFPALTNYTNVYIHLHAPNIKRTNTPEDAEPVNHPKREYFYGRLRKVLITYTSASTLLAAHWLGRKRRAILHLDHLFSDWRHMVDMRGCYKFKYVVRLMGEDTQTEWELRYYVYTGCSERENGHWSNWDEQLAEEMDSIVGFYAQYANVKVVAEVYGS